MKIRKKNLTRSELNVALEIMDEEQLIFFPASERSREKLIKFVSQVNQELYGVSKFTYLASHYDANLIVFATPDLGRYQLGVFSTKWFKAGEPIALYEGETIKDAAGSFVWVEAKSQFGIDASLKGTIARFVNHSLTKNAELKRINGKLYYVATRNIPAGTEITTSYGFEFFTEEHPLIEREPQTLQGIFEHLFHFKKQGEIGYTIKNKEDVYNALIRLKWDLSSFLDKGGSHLLTDKYTNETPNTQETKNPSQDTPLIFDVTQLESNNNNNCQSSYSAVLSAFENQIKSTFIRTSTRKFYLSPLKFDSKCEYRFCLFAAEPIEKDEEICSLKNFEVLTEKELKIREKEEGFDDNLLFQHGRSKIFYYTKTNRSEATFIQGVSQKKQANSILQFPEIPKSTFDTNKLMQLPSPVFRATKKIKPGHQITTFFGCNYDLNVEPHSLEVAVERFNSSQNSWTAFFKRDKESCSVKVIPGNQEEILEVGTIESPRPSNDNNKKRIIKSNMRIASNSVNDLTPAESFLLEKYKQSHSIRSQWILREYKSSYLNAKRKRQESEEGQILKKRHY